jgi:hypothetical protein
MEQRLDATYLRPGLCDRAAALGLAAVAIGTGILLGAWGISFLWRYTPPEIAVRVTQGGPLTVSQDKPFELAKPEPLKVEPGGLTVKVEPQSPTTSAIGGDAKTAVGEVIMREVTVFSTVKHGTGHVTTGWRYRDGTGSVPLGQYCYYSAPNNDSSSTRIEIAVDGARLPTISASLVPELEGALAKCQWWKR